MSVRVHEMRIYCNYFDLILMGKKNTEVRLYDKKRRDIGLKDHIVFTCIGAKDCKIEVKVVGLAIFQSIEELVAEVLSWKKWRINSEQNYLGMVAGIRRIYNWEQSEKEGMIAIKFERVRG